MPIPATCRHTASPDRGREHQAFRLVDLGHNRRHPESTRKTGRGIAQAMSAHLPLRPRHWLALVRQQTKGDADARPDRSSDSDEPCFEEPPTRTMGERFLPCWCVRGPQIPTTGEAESAQPTPSSASPKKQAPERLRPSPGRRILEAILQGHNESCSRQNRTRSPRRDEDGARTSATDGLRY